MRNNKLKQKALLLLLLVAAGMVAFTSCTKTSGCEYETGGVFLTGTFHYHKNPVKIPKWPFSNVTILDVNAYLIKDEQEGTLYDTVLLTKHSIPNEYRKEGETHVAVSVVSTISGITTTEVRHDFYKLLCIEKND